MVTMTTDVLSPFDDYVFRLHPELDVIATSAIGHEVGAAQNFTSADFPFTLRRRDDGAVVKLLSEEAAEVLRNLGQPCRGAEANSSIPRELYTCFLRQQ